MTLNIKKGDLIAMARQGEFDIIVHGANCFNTFGSGIARQIRTTWMQPYIADAATLSGDYNKLGNYTHSQVEDGRVTVINAYTQYNYNRPGENLDLFEYTSFAMILQKLFHNYGKAHLRWGFPMIGMGLAGGDPARIIAMIEDFSQKISIQGGSVTLVEFVK